MSKGFRIARVGPTEKKTFEQGIERLDVVYQRVRGGTAFQGDWCH